MDRWAGKRVFITGVCGTVGKELLRQVVDRRPAEVVGIDNNESELFFVKREYGSLPHVHLFVGDTRGDRSMTRRMEGADVVLHTAAFKHVELCEESPRDTVINNVLGLQNVVDAAIECGVERMIFTSSDKAVNPTNVMGTSKLMGERLMSAASGMNRSENGPVFAATRFGNVLGSRGSVIPLFKKQIVAGGPVTLTDPGMSRFIMSLDQAVELVMDSVFLARGGEVFVTKMPAVSITDLAEVMIQELAPMAGHDPKDIELRVIGTKPGEKMYEELLNEEETRRTVELERYFVVLPALEGGATDAGVLYPGLLNDQIEMPYNSANQPKMSADELRAFLHEKRLLTLEGESPAHTREVTP